MPHKIFISADHGMAIIYFLQSDVVPTLLDAGVEIVVLTDDETKTQIANRFARPGLTIEGLRLKEANKYANSFRPRLQWLLAYLRRVGGSWRINTEAMDSHIWEVWVENSWKFRLGIWLPAALAILVLRTFAFARSFLVRAQNQFIPNLYADLCASHKPDLVIASTAGWRLDRYLLREAHAHGIPTMAAIVGAALDAVQSALGLADWKTATRLLRSSHIAAAAAEQDARVRLDVKLRSEGRSHPTDGAALARTAKAAGAPQFAAALETARAALSGPSRRSAGAWAEAFGGALGSWGWARGVSPESSDWQAANRFGEMLRELGALGAIARDLTAAQAFAELRALVTTPFQPESGEPSIFVLDGWEDPGLDFDSLWVAGLTATAFPRPARVDAFLPIEAQRRFGMPRATAESCIGDAQGVLAAWRTHAAALVLSWPAHVDDTDADASPLLPERLPALPASGAFALRTELQHGAAVLEGVDEDAAPPLDGRRAPGGARVLELQAACPFRAFAELRLHARPLEEPQTGFDRRLRGQVLHRALEQFWSDLGSQDALLALQGHRRIRVDRVRPRRYSGSSSRSTWRSTLSVTGCSVSARYLRSASFIMV